MRSTIKTGKYCFCGTCGYLKNDGETSDCFNCYQKEKERMKNEFNEEMD